MFKTLKKIGMLAASAGLLGFSATEAQDVDPAKWVLSESGAEIVNYLGRQSIHLNNGIASLKDTQFRNGTISFDIAMEEKRGFSGVYFRVNENSGEHFYLRPHMSGKPDANQYTPLFNGVSGWQIYHSPRFASPTEYRFDEWMHVRLVVKDETMDVYIDSDAPILHVDNLMGPDAAGGIRFNGGFQNFHISNVMVIPSDDVQTVGTAASRAELPENLIRNFKVGSVAL